MAHVIESLTGVPDRDIRAMSVYLSTLPASERVAPDRSQSEPPLPGRAARLFESACASCHDPVFTDSLTVARSALVHAPALRAPTPEALLTVLDQRISAPETRDLREMPSFRSEFPAEDLAELAVYLRARFAPDLPAWD